MGCTGQAGKREGSAWCLPWHSGWHGRKYNREAVLLMQEEFHSHGARAAGAEGAESGLEPGGMQPVLEHLQTQHEFMISFSVL